jgi:CheY-like chemotaxis protein/two-component sensor histidine kinase
MDELDPSHPYYAALAEVVEGSHRAAALTRQLLAYAGKGQFVIELVDLSRLVRDIVSLIDASIPILIHLELTLRDSLLPVQADASQLQQLIMNLVINAAEAIGEGCAGTIRINTGLQEISPLYIARNAMAAHDEISPGPYVYLEVRDTGCGMTEDVRSRIFDPFFTTKFTGRGLGLAAVRGIVRGLKGTIELYSTPGHGTTFRILFPAAESHAADAADTRRLSPAGHQTGTILVADDESYVRQLARAALERQGFSVLLAGDGNSAVEVFEANRDSISAVLLDMTMPGRGGTEVYHILKRARPDLPIVLSSGYNESDVLRSFPGCNGISFLQKPYTSQRLIEKMRAAFAGEQR